MIWRLFRSKDGDSPDHELGPSFLNEKPRLIIDISVLHKRDAGTGIQRVVRNVWNKLRELDQEYFELVPVFARDNGVFYLASLDFIELSEENGRQAALQPCIARTGDVFLGLDFSPILLPRCERVLRNWRRLGVSVNLIVYDLLPETNPEWFTRRGVRNYRRWLTFLAKHADRALCISSDVARQLREVLCHRRGENLNDIAIEVFPMGTEFGGFDEKSFPPPGLDVGERRPIILMVGTIEPRKGYDFALKVFETLWRASADEPVAVIIGKAGWKTEKLQLALRGDPHAGRSLFWFEDADDRQLAWLYAHSAVFFSASLAEGFGLPLLEARSCGLPVVATDLPVFHEFVGEGVAFFEVGDISQAASLLADAVGGNRPERAASALGRPTWADTAADILRRIAPDKR